MKRARHDEPEDAVDGEGGESVRIDMTSVSASIAASTYGNGPQLRTTCGPWA